MDRFECRKALWKDMRAADLVLKEEPYMMKIPRSQRGGEIIEPMVSTQWFVSMESLAKPAIKAVEGDDIAIIPEHFKKVYFNWLENIQDWCISRQLWWGHRIPVWYCHDCGHMTVSRTDPSHCDRCESAAINQDPDVLDTWFSSGLWPFSTLGWPDDTPDYRYFYPTSIMETGYDILFFWVARMIITGREFTGKNPFHTVYLHGLIRDEQGRKMSKTTGNVIDPLEVMDEMGTDALRFTLLVGSTPGNDMNLSLKKVEANRNFANKVWNVGRLILRSLSQAPSVPHAEPNWTSADRWIQAKLARLVREVNRLFDHYQYGEAGRQIYDFLWNEFADWYLEISKLQVTEGGDRAFYTVWTMVRTFDTCLRLLHPFTPFVTEELWGHLKQAAQSQSSRLGPEGGWEEALIIAGWPEPSPEAEWEAPSVEAFEQVMGVVKAIRNLRAEYHLQAGRRVPAILAAGVDQPIMESQRTSLAELAHLDPDGLKIVESLEGKPDGHIALVSGSIEIFLPLGEMVDPEEERRRLREDLEEAQTQIQRLEKLLASPFSKRAPREVVQKEREKLSQYITNARKLKEQLNELQG
jgi:valyl-tRNA synthetase